MAFLNDPMQHFSAIGSHLVAIGFGNFAINPTGDEIILFSKTNLLLRVSTDNNRRQRGG